MCLPRGEKSPSKVGSTTPCSSRGLNKKEKGHGVPAFISFCFLTGNRCDQLPHSPATGPSWHWQTESSDCIPKQPFPSLRYFCDMSKMLWRVNDLSVSGGLRISKQNIWLHWHQLVTFLLRGSTRPFEWYLHFETTGGELNCKCNRPTPKPHFIL